MKFFLSEAISKKEIKIEKIVIAENVQNELFKIIDTKGPEGMLLRLLKNHSRESEYHFAE